MARGFRRCGKLFEYRGTRGDNSGRFCSDHCRAEYDLPGAFSCDPFKVTNWKVVAGGDPSYLVATPMTRISGSGWRVACRGCGRQFESSGLAYCKPTCRQASAERAEAAALMAPDRHGRAGAEATLPGTRLHRHDPALAQRPAGQQTGQILRSALLSGPA